METLEIENYLKRIQELACLLDNDPRALQEILHFIQCAKDKVQDNQPKLAFFMGEYDFYNGSYERALKYYLEAKGAENFEFYCYRASAFIASGMGQSDKALKFVNKALSSFPNDSSLLKLLSHLLLQAGETKEAAEIQTKLLDFKDKYQVVTSKKAEQMAQGFFEQQPRNTQFEISPFAEDIPPLMIKKIEKTVLVDKVNDDAFINLQREAAFAYLEQQKTRKKPINDGLYILQGWSNEWSNEQLSIFREGSHKSSGGFFIEWHGHGIVINPGTHFFKNFERAGLHIRDINSIIVTSEDIESYTDIKQIYDINYQLNRTEFHLINYYLNQKVYQKLTGVLKPRFKQERHAIHKLESFFESHESKLCENKPCESESFNLNDAISAEYFSVELAGSTETHIRIELLGEGIVIEYSPSKVLIHYENKQMILLTQFDALHGDTRFHQTEKMREEHPQSGVNVFPADIDLFIDLPSIGMKCSASGKIVDPSEIRVLRSGGDFSRLQYLSPMSLL